ncbi:CHAT domain-containing protein [Hyalangium sp.]|uniref:CHAT domain-containing protein n=1 Tax=Hyalangium sp. TaxID=2028555 RepID=UPI002D2A5BA0|nr:CHAT domain-containing protein [Hyalangium sp.]HYH98601.1 CHAT domain-containing protein [Hyalangium sp.]
MDSLCDKAGLFVDGELPTETAEAFRQHLPDCARCQHEVNRLLQFDLLGHDHVRLGAAQAPPGRSRLPVSSLWRRPVLWVGASLAAILLAVVAVRLRAPAGLGSDVWLAERPQRLLEARLSHPAADRHRPPAARMMGGDRSSDALPFEDLAVLEKSDPQGLAAAYLVRDDPKLVDLALQRLEGLGRSPGLESDRAAAMLLKGEPHEALRRVEGVLAEHPRHPQALWNRGLALRELGLPLLAARSFTEVASLKEPGWSEEAAQKAESLQRETSERHDRWKAIFEAGKALVDAAPGKLPEGFSQAPIARLHFYDAVRASPSRERVLALLPLARELDAQAGGRVLEDYVQRVAEADFSQRAPLARDYAALVQQRLPDADKERLLTALRASAQDDLLLGALTHLRAASRNLELFEAKAAATGDPWFQQLAAQQRALADKAAGRWVHATQTLLEARRLCTQRGLEYRCSVIDRELATLYIRLHQLDAARKHAESGWKLARAGNEWMLERDLLWILAQIARFVNDAPLARACFQELLERDRNEPDMVRRVHQNLADIALHELQVEEARREIDAALATGLPLLPGGTLTLADISRLKSALTDEAHLTRAVEAARPGLSPGERAVSTHVLGRFFIERDVARGRDLLWQAIREAEAPELKNDPGARRARAYSYTSLILEAGRRGAFEEALELFAKERGQALPRLCLLAATVDSERTLLVVRGADGALVGHHDESRRQPLPPQLDGLVPEALLAPLRACSQVEVLARPPLHGRAGLLPPELAWSYLTRASAPRPPPAGPAVHLVVSGVELPPGIPLRRLNAWTPVFGPQEQRLTLSGAEATPSRVLAFMRNATEIDLVAHGIVNDSTDNSYILLAPEQDGPELGISKVRAAPFQRAPFVVLAACHAAHTAYALHEPLSLPAAFIEAGARGVLAATEEIPDLEAEAFFNAVRERMRSGTSPAVALRDERTRWSKEGKGARWLDSVLLFE